MCFACGGSIPGQAHRKAVPDRDRYLESNHAGNSIQKESIMLRHAKDLENYKLGL
jgi:hypothetical protein